MSEYTRQYGGSPVFTTSLGILVAGASDIIDYENDTFAGISKSAARFLPLDSLRCINNSSVTIRIYFNQQPSDTREILPGQDVNIPRKRFNSIRVHNTHATTDTTSAQVIIEAEKEPVTGQGLIEEAAKQAYERGFIR